MVCTAAQITAFVEGADQMESVENNAVNEWNKRIQGLVLKNQGQDADPEELAKISRKAFKNSRRKSLEHADDDAKHAEQYLSDTRKSWGRNNNSSSGVMRFFSRKRK
jgi:replicative superfamily II helicase